MMTLLSLAGFLVAIVIFLNLLSAGSPGSSKDGTGEKGNLPPRGNHAALLKQSPEAGPRPRICPVCGTLLGKDDYLIAAMEPDPGAGKKRRAQIYGCPFCYVSGGVNLTSGVLEKIEP